MIGGRGEFDPACVQNALGRRRTWCDQQRQGERADSDLQFPEIREHLCLARWFVVSECDTDERVQDSDRYANC
jgi:hypothetical protein